LKNTLRYCLPEVSKRDGYCGSDGEGRGDILGKGTVIGFKSP